MWVSPGGVVIPPPSEWSVATKAAEAPVVALLSSFGGVVGSGFNRLRALAFAPSLSPLLLLLFLFEFAELAVFFLDTK